MKTNTTHAASDIITMCDSLERTMPDHLGLPLLQSRRFNLEVWIVHHGGGRGDQVWDAEMRLTCTGIVDAAKFCEAHNLLVSMLEFHSQYRPTP